jgi:hypothetical protein
MSHGSAPVRFPSKVWGVKGILDGLALSDMMIRFWRSLVFVRCSSSRISSSSFSMSTIGSLSSLKLGSGIVSASKSSKKADSTDEGAIGGFATDMDCCTCGSVMSCSKSNGVGGWNRSGSC